MGSSGQFADRRRAPPGLGLVAQESIPDHLRVQMRN
jgi:hypothetical protein